MEKRYQFRDPIDRKRAKEGQQYQLLERMGRAIMQQDFLLFFPIFWPGRRRGKGVNWLKSF